MRPPCGAESKYEAWLTGSCALNVNDRSKSVDAITPRTKAKPNITLSLAVGLGSESAIRKIVTNVHAPVDAVPIKKTRINGPSIFTSSVNCSNRNTWKNRPKIVANGAEGHHHASILVIP